MSEKRLGELARVFLKLGFIAFGGPAAHIGMMEKEVVDKRKWMERQHFLDLVGATNLIPGPNSTEMTMHCGHERAGWKGLFVAGSCFIFPAVAMTGVLAWFYAAYGEVPAIAPFFDGIKPAVLAIILSAILKLGRKALKNWQLGLIGALVIAASLLGVSEILAILAAGLVGLIWMGVPDAFRSKRSDLLWPVLLFQTGAVATQAVSSAKLFFVFLKIGAILFGSGYVLVAYLDGELVQRLQWLTRQELLDAIAIGQFTPGPVLSTATFVGFQINGWSGALAATAGIFLPSFFFVLLLNPIVPRLRKSRLAAAFLDAVNIGAVGIMVAVMLVLGGDILIDWKAWLIAVISTALVFGRPATSSVWIVIGGAVAGFVLSYL